jgi:PAS domain S-box-containing protein
MIAAFNEVPSPTTLPTPLDEERAARRQLEALLEFAPAFIIGVTARGTIDFINRTLPQHDKKDVIGASWLQYFPPDRQAIMTEALRKTLDAGATQTFENNTPGPDGETMWFDSHIAPVTVDGRIVGAVLVSQDVTERKRAQAELLAGRHMALLGTLAAGVAHEINTPIQFIGDSIQFLRQSCAEMLALFEKVQSLRQSAAHGQPLAEAIAEAEQAEQAADLPYLRENMPEAFERCIDGLNRVATIVRSLKEFAHPASGQMGLVDLNRVVQNTLTIATNEYKYVARLETDFGDLPPVTCYAGEIGQAVLNIVVNAAHAIADVVKDSDKKGLISVRTQQQGQSVLITISDTGTGIPEQVRARIFDPFFTTKEVGRGSGQGLAIAWSTVTKAHGGELTFDTKPNEGTTFYLRIPIAGRPSEM